jgi:hypothetical protein
MSFDEVTITERLVSLYENHLPVLLDQFKNIDTSQEKISYPLLLNVTSEYCTSNKKLMIVGKETYQWGWKNDDIYLNISKEKMISQLMGLYRDFLDSTNSKASPFWNMTLKLLKHLNPDTNKFTSLAWNNLIKIDVGKKRAVKYEDMLAQNFPVFLEEIKILKPDVVLFFTAHSYDARLLKTLIENDELPFHSYRTYHPAYLRRSKKENEIVDKLIQIFPG